MVEDKTGNIHKAHTLMKWWYSVPIFRPKFFSMQGICTFTVTTSHNNRDIKALLVPGDNASNKTIRQETEPCVTDGNTRRVGNISRALLVGDQQRQYANGDEPAHTVRALNTGGSPPRGLFSGRVVKMTLRALARFQSIPDDYILPDNKRLAMTVIGNAVPPLMYQKIIGQLIYVR